MYSAGMHLDLPDPSHGRKHSFEPQPHDEEAYRRSILICEESLSDASIEYNENFHPEGVHERDDEKKHSGGMALPEIRIAYPPRGPNGVPPRSQRLMYFAEASDAFLAFLVVLFALSAGGHSVVWFYFLGKLNTAISEAYNITTCEDKKKVDPEFMFNVLLAEKNIWHIYKLLLVLVWVFFSCLFLDICVRMVTFRQLKRLKLVLFAKLLSLDAGWYDENEIGHLMEQMTITMSQVEISVGSLVGESLFKVFLAFIGFIGTMPQGWRLSLLINGVMIPANFFRVLVSASLRDRLMVQQTKLYGEAASASEETLSGISVVWAFNGQKQQIQKYNEKLNKVKVASNKAGLKIGLTRGFAEFICMGGQSLAMWYLIKVSSDYPEQYGLDEFFGIFVTSLSSTYMMSMGMSGLEQVMRSRSAIKSLVNIIETPSAIDPLDPGGQKLESVAGEIEFRNIHFSYPTRKEAEVLPGLSLTISSGKTYALVGESGNGKSTIVQLLLRLYDPDDGEVSLDGANLKDLNVEWYRSQIGVVSQMPTLFCGTVRDNITGGDHHATEEGVINAAKNANIHEFVLALPEQYETPIGEGGGGLSGGQKQRIAIARALYKNPKILILDEATSALDNESEKVVQQALNKAREGRTTLVIAHRLSTVRDADVIIVLDKGHILEQGSHEALMNQKGMYYALVVAQQVSGAQAVPSIDDIPRNTVDALPVPPPSGGRLSRLGIQDMHTNAPRLSMAMQRDALTSMINMTKSTHEVQDSAHKRKKSVHALEKSSLMDSLTIKLPGNEDVMVNTKGRKKSRPKNLTGQMMKFLRKDYCVFFITLIFVMLRSFEQPLNCFFLLSLIKLLWSMRDRKNAEIWLCLGFSVKLDWLC